MTVQLLPPDDQYVLNHCTRHLARADFDQIPTEELSTRISEAWRFPIIDSYRPDSTESGAAPGANRVTFIYAVRGLPEPQQVAVIGTFAPLYAPLPLRRAQFLGTDTRYWATTVVVPHNQVHTYTFLVDDTLQCDPINPQRVLLDNNESWSRFFTHYCTHPLTLTRLEAALLQRITDHILPFRTSDGQRFLDRHAQALVTSGSPPVAGLYRLDEPVGVVNFIDNILAREEHHNRADYKICLGLIDQLLRQRHAGREPCDLDGAVFTGLYSEMTTDQVVGWDHSRYRSPRYFLQMLRRHAFTGAFAHPKYGGNVQAAGWSYLEQRYNDSAGQTLFDWRRAIEPPLGADPDYRG
jgi:hypothetical protein